MTYRTEFPDFDADGAAKLDSLIATGSWDDTAWHNEPCPSVTCDVFVLYADYADPDQREFPESPRFTMREGCDVRFVQKSRHGALCICLGPVTISGSRWPWQKGYDWRGETNPTAPLNRSGARFGAGWKWCLGVRVGGSSAIIELLFGFLTVSWGNHQWSSPHGRMFKRT